jgi:glycosyltransferase involved in cell wall biosynthesis
MRILYVSKETPFTPAGGIATYLAHMVPAMRAAGHEAFLFTWTDARTAALPADTAPFDRDRVHVEHVDPDEIWRIVPVASRSLCLSTWLADRLLRRIEEWGIDVVEATDYLAPALTAFQRLQTRPGAARRLCVTYNHGFIEDFYEADQIAADRGAEIDHLCERQQCRASDLVVAPSQAARARLEGYGIGRIHATREPYLFRRAEPVAPEPVRDVIDYVGRISISKGIDKLVYLANVLHEVRPLRQIRLIGRVVDTPFRRHDMRAYLRDRLRPELREALFLTGYLERQTALNLLEPGAISPSLGSAETFSYACAESIDAGLVPVVRHGTPMAEFLPPDLGHHVLDAEMRSVRGLQAQLARYLDAAPALLPEIRRHCRETLAPDRIAEDMGTAYDRALRAKRRVKVFARSERQRATIGDVTILVPAHRPDHAFMETVDSVARQTAGTPRMLICDDGSPDSHTSWFDYARAMLPACRIVRQPNSGLLAARNTLAEACETRLSVFLDTDDILHPEFLDQALAAFNHAPSRPDAVIPQRQNFGESAECVLGHLLEDHLHFLQNDYRMTALVRTEILRRIGFDATRRNGEGDDWAFWLDFTGRGHVAALLPERGLHYRFRRGSMSWPWSEGQTVGTQTMVRETAQRMCAAQARHAGRLARAFYAQALRR